MDYNYQISWSNLSLKDLDNILEYLQDEWSEKEVKLFKSLLSKKLGLISKYPKLFPSSKIRPSIRRSVLSKQTSIFYNVDSDNQKIDIIRLFDNRMDPESL